MKIKQINRPQGPAMFIPSKNGIMIKPYHNSAGSYAHLFVENDELKGIREYFECGIEKAVEVFRDKNEERSKPTITASGTDLGLHLDLNGVKVQLRPSHVAYLHNQTRSGSLIV